MDVELFREFIDASSILNSNVEIEDLKNHFKIVQKFRPNIRQIEIRTAVSYLLKSKIQYDHRKSISANILSSISQIFDSLDPVRGSAYIKMAREGNSHGIEMCEFYGLNYAN